MGDGSEPDRPLVMARRSRPTRGSNLPECQWRTGRAGFAKNLSIPLHGSHAATRLPWRRSGKVAHFPAPGGISGVMASIQLPVVRVVRPRTSRNLAPLTKRAYRGPDQLTLLLRNVVRRDTREAVASHLWFTAGKWSRRLRKGDKVAFDARVGEYVKGYLGRRQDVDSPPSLDYRLERPTKVVVISRDSEEV